MKIKSFIQNNFMAVVALAIVIGFSAFKVHKKVNPQSGWYSISSTSNDPNQKDDQTISGFVSTSTPTGNCSPVNTSDLCQVHLNLDNFNSSSPIENMTVEEAVLAGAVAGTYARSDED